MTNPLHAAYYADSARQLTAAIVENVRIAKDTYRLRVQAPEIASQITPGQFLMLKVAGANDPLIGRPLALYDLAASAGRGPDAIDVVYVVKGKFTTRAAELVAGQHLDIWGPLGNGFLPPQAGNQSYADHLIMVAGGIGFTPFFAVAKEALGAARYGASPRPAWQAKRVTFCYGARSAGYLIDIAEFEKLGVRVRIATDDGSRGHHGLVTDLLRATLEESGNSARVLCCGPEPMMEAVAKITQARGVPCELSLETPMACGIGICFTCVAKVKQPGGDWDYKRTCVEGPVFAAELIAW